MATVQPNPGQDPPSRFWRPMRARPTLPAAALLLLLLGTALIYLARLDSFQVGTYMDDARYIIAARSLASGRGFSQINFSDAPSETHFPPGYPLVLAPIAALFPRALIPFQVLSVVLTLAALPLWLKVVRPLAPPGVGLWVIAATAVSPLVLAHATMVMSEALFFLLLPLLFLAVGRIGTDSTNERQGAVTGGLILVALFYVRNAGAVFYLATLLFLFAGRRFKSAGIVSAVFLVPAFAWLARYRLLVGDTLSSGYANDLYQRLIAESGAPSLTGALGKALEITWYYLSAGLAGGLGTGASGQFEGASLAGGALRWLPALTGLATSGLVLIGLGRSLARRRALPYIALAVYLIAICWWPYRLERLLHPIVPLLYLALFEGIVAVSVWLRAGVGIRLARSLAMTSLVVLVLADLVRAARSYADPVRNRITDISLGASWIAEHTPPDSVVMSTFPFQRYLYADRLVASLPVVADPSGSHLFDAIQRSGARYVLLAPPLRSPRAAALDPPALQAAATMASSPHQFRVVLADSPHSVWIYEVVAPW